MQPHPRTINTKSSCRIASVWTLNKCTKTCFYFPITSYHIEKPDLHTHSPRFSAAHARSAVPPLTVVIPHLAFTPFTSPQALTIYLQLWKPSPRAAIHILHWQWLMSPGLLSQTAPQKQDVVWSSWCRYSGRNEQRWWKCASKAETVGRVSVIST